MIHIDRYYSSDFLDSYSKEVFEDILKDKLESFSVKYPSIVFREKEFFTRTYLDKILLVMPGDLKELIRTIFKTFPEVYEFLHCDQYHKSIELPSFELEKHDFTTKIEQRIFVQYVQSLREKLAEFKDKSIVYSWAYQALGNLSRQKDAKVIYGQLKALVSGKRIKNINSIFPLWVYDFCKFFDYEKLSKEKAYNIIKNSGITVCPYCNEINIYLRMGDERDYRSDLDHYFPKSKFPFLSLSIYNLIPACSICNQKLKKDVDTYHYKFGNPYLLENFHECLFYLDSGDLLRGIDKLKIENISIKLQEIGSELDENFKILDIENRYNHTDFKIWGLDYIDLKDTLESINLNGGSEGEFNTKLHYVMRNLGRARSPLETKFKKFSLDIHNQLFKPAKNIYD